MARYLALYFHSSVKVNSMKKLYKVFLEFERLIVVKLGNIKQEKVNLLELVMDLEEVDLFTIILTNYPHSFMIIITM